MPVGNPLSYAARIYVAGVVAAGIFAVAHSLLILTANAVPWQWAMLAGLTLLSGSFTVRIPGISARLSVSDTFVFAAVLLFGPAAATMIVVLDTLVIAFWLGRSSVPPARLVFNLAAPAVAIWGSSHTFYFLARIEPLSITPQPVLSIAFPLLGLATLYFLLNSWLIAIAVALQRKESAYRIWKNNFLWLSLNYFSGASVAALLLPYLLQADTYEAFLYVTGVLLPVLIIFYLTFKAALGRVDDANKHLTELNHLYLSTIETLAMAIDAKDQITHGHIRRVQQYAVGLARHIGVTESAQISAIEAASLLHDMGKLAVPEYILNKPGRLTPAEFEKMKLHASVGADILAAIDFPYPVVPIVRHHHECWDGSGYPDGLRGTDIPIGARILAVVDCFDALTSDRPYRPRLSDPEAIDILLERRGTMYDPLVVDAFLEVHETLAVATVERHGSSAHFSAIARVRTSQEVPDTSSRLEQISASTEEMLVLYDLARSLASCEGVSHAVQVITNHIRRLLPANLYIFYIFRPDTDDLVASHASGENASQFLGLRIARGERLTGWVAANGQTILNSDPALDLGDAARSVEPRLQSCLSTPLAVDRELIGVLTLYSSRPGVFSDEHRRIIEAIARQTSPALRRAIESDSDRGLSLHNAAGSRNVAVLQEFIATEFASLSQVSLLVIRVKSLGAGSVDVRSDPVQRVLAHIENVIRCNLRRADVLFRYSIDLFLVLLVQTDASTASVLSERISKGIAEHLLTSDTTDTPHVTVGLATAPRDGHSIESLVSTASARERLVLEPPSRSSIH
jgi:putative nucleotidyltransferase with HDIG domain